jgi:hypothetical protein
LPLVSFSLPFFGCFLFISFSRVSSHMSKLVEIIYYHCWERLEFEALLWFSCFQLLSVNHMFSVLGFSLQTICFVLWASFIVPIMCFQLWASLCHMVKLVEIWYLHLLEWRLLIAKVSPKNVRFGLRDPNYLRMR